MSQRSVVLRTLASAAFLVALAALSGCAAEPSPAVEAAHETPTATSVPVVNDPLRPGSWLIDFDGIGPFALGSDAELAEGEVNFDRMAIDEKQCPRTIYLKSKEDPTLWLAAMSDLDGGVGLSMVSAYLGETVGALPSTAVGIRAGSTLDEVLAAYPGIALVDALNPPILLYGVQNDAGHWIYFTLDDGHTVDFITVTNTQIQPYGWCS